MRFVMLDRELSEREYFAIQALCEEGESVEHRIRTTQTAVIAELVSKGQRKMTAERLIEEGAVEVGYATR